MVNEEIIKQILDLLNNTTVKADEKPLTTVNEPIEMLTVKECASEIRGLSEHTVRQLIAQNKIPYIRTGKGKRGKILVNKRGLLEYLTSLT